MTSAIDFEEFGNKDPTHTSVFVRLLDFTGAMNAHVVYKKRYHTCTTEAEMASSSTGYRQPPCCPPAKTLHDRHDSRKRKEIEPMVKHVECLMTARRVAAKYSLLGVRYLVK